jgi:gamma-glutamyl-gamma-aminobutyrate hydrolase PuuD
VNWQQKPTVGNLKIALTQRVLYHKGRAYDSIEHGWYRYLKNHTLSFIPNRLDQDFEQLADGHDCLIITGGDDSAIRRTVEFKLATAVMKQQKPILGVCHGAFLLTDALGGQVNACEGHMDTEHAVEYFGQEHTVNSYHTQAIAQLHSTATGLVYDSSGHCEAWIDQRIAGVVWHPERMNTPWLPTEISNLFLL